jgi:hypothetical protein
MIDIETIIHSPVNHGPIINNPPTTTLPPDVKAVATALLARCFRNARAFDHVMLREGWRDDDGYLRDYSDDETTALDTLAEVLGIDPLDVSYPVVARERGEA